MSIFDVPPNELIEKVARELEKVPEIIAPEWAKFAKTGMHKERPPANTDWWHLRAAAILRSTAKLGPVGVSKLRTKYGGKKNRGVGSEHFYKGSGSVARKILQQLEKAGLMKQAKKGAHKGRMVTPKGQSLLDKTAKAISKTIVKEKPIAVKKTEKKPEDAQTMRGQGPAPRKGESGAKTKSGIPQGGKKEAPKTEAKQEKPKEEKKHTDKKAEEKPKAEKKHAEKKPKAHPKKVAE